MKEIREALEKVINDHSLENKSDTPDFILAQYLYECFDAFNNATKKRANWYKNNGTIPTDKLQDIANKVKHNALNDKDTEAYEEYTSGYFDGIDDFLDEINKEMAKQVKSTNKSAYDLNKVGGFKKK